MNVPKLRFKEFSGEWEQTYLKDVITRINRVSDDFAPSMMITADSGFVLQSEKYSKDMTGESLKKYITLFKGELAYNHGASKLRPYGSTYVLKEKRAKVPFVYHCFAINQGITDFYGFYLNRWEFGKKLKPLISSTARLDGLLNISFESILNIKVNTPNLIEQEKIAEFLNLIDEKISIQKDIVVSLEKQKKGLMQKIFSQELRFKDDEGKEFPAWEEKKLGEVGEIITGKTPDTNKAEFWNGDIQFITPVDMGIGKYLRASERTVTEKVKMKILPIGTVMVTCIGATIGKMAITTRMAITNQQINTIYSDTANNEFLYYALLNIVPQIRRMKSNTTMPILNKSEFSALCIKLPCADEQNKIALFLSLLDEKIEKENACLEHWQQIKKGLLQQMFV